MTTLSVFDVVYVAACAVAIRTRELGTTDRADNTNRPDSAVSTGGAVSADGAGGGPVPLTTICPDCGTDTGPLDGAAGAAANVAADRHTVLTTDRFRYLLIGCRGRWVVDPRSVDLDALPPEPVRSPAGEPPPVAAAYRVIWQTVETRGHDAEFTPARLAELAGLSGPAGASGEATGTRTPVGPNEMDDLVRHPHRHRLGESLAELDNVDTVNGDRPIRAAAAEAGVQYGRETTGDGDLSYRTALVDLTRSVTSITPVRTEPDDTGPDDTGPGATGPGDRSS